MQLLIVLFHITLASFLFFFFFEGNYKAFIFVLPKKIGGSSSQIDCLVKYYENSTPQFSMLTQSILPFLGIKQPVSNSFTLFGVGEKLQRMYLS